MKDVNWDDLKLFHIVASEGGLAGAAGLTGISAPTIGRRMLFLERTMGRTLFIRSQQGYRLAPDGLTLFERVPIHASRSTRYQPMARRCLRAAYRLHRQQHLDDGFHSGQSRHPSRPAGCVSAVL
ncbi:helix-turn-helix domain-containing protein [Agrobacterium rubi]|uniref:helix-turn-helix domain-containing protein n=1 Tax=Agrobacterium rubi TaxID=28099 RepID=UPI001F3686DA|nr:LysR family transcriptional regulator [Agrobacterium rubi]